MNLARFFPTDTRIDFIRQRFIAFVVTGVMIIGSILSLAVHGLNLGIDFSGGILIEVRVPTDVRLADMRDKLSGLGLGEVTLQTFGGPNEILIRAQTSQEDEKVQQEAVQAIKEALGPDYEYRRTEVVGPSISQELLRDGAIATTLAVLAIAAYVWFRFEWQYGVAALIATFHDVVTTLGLLSVFDIEFNLASVAAILTVAGYSINDTVVVFDRIRENLRRYRRMPFPDLINRSVNEMLSRTILTSGTTMIAVVALLLLAGPVIYNFNIALAWGVLVGTYSSVYVAGALLLYMKPPHAEAVGRREADQAPAE